MTFLKTTKAVALGALIAATSQFALPDAAQAKSKDGKHLIYLSLSYSGNSWQSEAANIVKALAATPPYNETVELVLRPRFPTIKA